MLLHCAMLFIIIHLFSFTSAEIKYQKQCLQVSEIFNFSQDDLMTEDIFILYCHSEIFVWVGQQVDPKSKMQALTIGEVLLVLPCLRTIKLP